MLPFILFTCLIVQIALAIKLYMLNPHRKLNIFISLVPTIFMFSTILEINIYYTTDAVRANQLYYFYQCLSFIPLIFSTLAYVEYIKMYSNTSSKRFLNGINISVVVVNVLWTLVIVIVGPTAKIFLSSPGKWSIDSSSMGLVFYTHTYSSLFWLIISVVIFIYIIFNAEGNKKKYWYGILSFFQLLIISAIIFFITSQQKSTPKFYLITSIPTTVFIFLQVWVLSNFTIFDINPKNVYADILAAINNWIIITDKKGNIRYINDIAAKYTGYSTCNLINQNAENIMEVKNKDSISLPIEEFLQESFENNFLELKIRFKKTHEQFNLQSSLKIVLLPDGTDAFLWVMIDTTRIEALRIQKELTEITVAGSKKAYEDIAFIMNITSHDMLTPLKTIIELNDMLKRENKLPIPNKSDELIGYIDLLSLQSLGLATQMIEYMRIEVVEKKNEWFEVNKMLEGLKLRLITVIAKSDAIIMYKGPIEICCDRRQINELLANLIENSLKYQTAKAPLIEIEITETEKTYHFSVRDNGIGIHQDFIPKLFSKYSREGKKQVTGTGIGLFLCKNIVEANHGQITVSNNKPDNGITIAFTIAKNDIEVLLD